MHAPNNDKRKEERGPCGRLMPQEEARGVIPVGWDHVLRADVFAIEGHDFAVADWGAGIGVGGALGNVGHRQPCAAERCGADCSTEHWATYFFLGFQESKIEARTSKTLISLPSCRDKHCLVFGQGEIESAQKKIKKLSFLSGQSFSSLEELFHFLRLYGFFPLSGFRKYTRVRFFVSK